MKPSVKSNKNPERIAILFLAAMLIFAVTCIGVVSQNAIGAFLSSLLCVAMTLLVVVAIAVVFGNQN